MDPNAVPPKVFISYSWTSEEYQQWVIDLATRLVGDGVHVLIDKWDLDLGQEKYAFMERMVTDPDVKHVLLMCDAKYVEKADGRKGGVGDETQIVLQPAYAKVDQKKFIPVLTERGERGEALLPAYLASRKYVDLSDSGSFAHGYNELLRHIFDKPATRRPAIGKPPAFLSGSDAVSTSTHLLRGTAPLKSTGSETSVRPQLPLDRLMYSIVTDLKAQRFLTEPSGEIDEVILSKIQELKQLRDVAIEWIRQVLEAGNDSIAAERLATFFEELISVADWPQGVTIWSEWRSDHLSFLGRELWLYALAILIESRRWDVAKVLLGTRLCATVRQTFGPAGYGELECYLRSLEEVNNSKRPSKRISILADLVKERADDPLISFDLLVQADFVLCMRGILGKGTPTAPMWYPRTAVYKTHLPQPFPLFVRWRAGQWAAGISALLGVSGREDVAKGLVSAGTTVLERYRFDYWPLDFFTLADLSDLVPAP